MGKKYFMVLLFSLLAWSLLCAADGYIRFSKEESSGVEVADYQAQFITLKTSVPGMHYQLKATDKHLYADLRFEDFCHTAAYGDPNMPVFYRLLVIPEGADYDIFVHKGRELVFDLLAETGADLVCPRQLPDSKCPPAGYKKPFLMHEKRYLADQPFPLKLVSTGDIIRARGLRLLPITIAPVRYNPAQGTLSAYPNITVTVKLRNAQLAATGKELRDKASRFRRIYELTALGYDTLCGLTNTEPFAKEDMLVITADNLESGLDSWVALREKKGYRVNLVTVGSIPNSSSAQGIKNYIQTLYDNPDTRPAWVVLVGDTDTIPTFTGSGSGTEADVVFGFLEGGDSFPDASISRISVRTPAALASYLTKVFNNEPVSSKGVDWMDDASLLAINQMTQYGEGAHDYVTDNFLEPNDWEANKLYERLGATKADAMASMNAGAMISNYTGHCNSSEWGFGSGINQTDVNSLTNTDMYFLAIGHCCSSAPFRNTECIGETWIRADNAAVAYWGASNSSQWEEDYYHAIFSYEGIFQEGLYEVSAANEYGKVKLWEHYGGTGSSQYYMDAYNCLGDGTTWVQHKEPTAMTVSAPDIIPNGVDYINVTVTTAKAPIQGALVSAYGPSLNVKGTAVTDTSGSAHVVFDQPVTLTGYFTLHVAKSGYYNFEKQVLVGATSDGIVAFNRSVYCCDSEVDVLLSDSDLEGQGTYTLTVTSTTQPGGYDLALTESSGGNFNGTLTLGTHLAVSHGDTLTVSYLDTDTGSGSSETKTDTATLDCKGPGIVDVLVESVSGNEASISFTTSEDAKSRLLYGLSADNLNQTMDVSTGYKTDHTVTITGLDPNTAYYFQVEATDSLDNTSHGYTRSLRTANELFIGDGAESQGYPLYAYYHDCRTQIIYHASQLNGPQTMSNLAFYVQSTPGQTLENWTIRMKHTTLDNYNTQANWESTGWTVVYQADETISQTGWVTFAFTTSFDYNGTDNLMIDFSFNNSSWTSNGDTLWTGASSTRAIYHYTDSNDGDPLTWSGSTPSPDTANHFLNLKLAIPGGAMTDEMYRFFNTLTGGHLYTTSEVERDYIINNLPHYNYEGPKFHVFGHQFPETVAAFRFFNNNTGIHLYTISELERDYILANLPNYSMEGVKFYVHKTQHADNTPMYRFFNTNTGGHLYTISDVERDYIINNLPHYNYEGIKFYVYKTEH